MILIDIIITRNYVVKHHEHLAGNGAQKIKLLFIYYYEWTSHFLKKPNQMYRYYVMNVFQF